MPVRSVLMAALLASFSFLATARACDPAWLNSPPFTPERALAQGAAVFVGRVTDIEEIRQAVFEPAPVVLYTAQRYRISFRVSEAFEFRRGHEYLVVAFREDNARGRPLVATIYCGTAETTDADAADHLAMLGAWLPPVKFDRVVPSPVVRPVRR